MSELNKSSGVCFENCYHFFGFASRACNCSKQGKVKFEIDMSW